MPGEQMLRADIVLANLDKAEVLAAETGDPLQVPTEAVRLIWMREPFRLLARPVLVDVRRLPSPG